MPFFDIFRALALPSNNYATLSICCLPILVKDYFYIQLRQSVSLALPLENVVEVLTLTRRDICPIPGIPSALLGVTNQRGHLLWVLELGDLLSDLLGLAPDRIQYRSRDRLTLVVLCANPDSAASRPTAPHLACVVAGLKGVVSSQTAQLKPIPASFSPSFSSFLAGVAELENGTVAVLNVSAIFAVLRIADKMST